MTDQVEIPDTDDDTAAAVRFMSIKLPKLLAVTGTVHAGMLEANAAVLAGNHVFDDLSEPDAKRVAGDVGLEVIRSDFALSDPADAIDDRANEVLVDRRGGWDARSAAGLAMHRAARALQDGTR